MKTKAKTTPEQSKPATSIDEILSNSGSVARTIPTIAQLTEAFAQTQANLDFGGNDNAQDLLRLTKIVIEHYENVPFSRNQFLLMGGHLDLPISRITLWFENWVTALQGEKRILVTDESQSAYNFSTYQFC